MQYLGYDNPAIVGRQFRIDVQRAYPIAKPSLFYNNLSPHTRFCRVIVP